MCCSYRNQCCCHNRNLCCPNVVFTPQQPIVRPITPVNPVTRNALSAIIGASTVENNAIVPITAGVSTPGTSITVSGNSIVIPAGFYAISYGVSATIPASTDTESSMSVQLYANGSPISYGKSSTNASSTLPGNMALTILYNAGATTTLTLNNVSGTNAILTETGVITVQQII